MRRRIETLVLAPLLLGLAVAPSASPAESICYGTTSNGRLENGCALPYEGENFTAYSRLGSVIGRTYVHCRVAEVVLAAYQALQRDYPDKVFVYGETGWASGGSFKPHKTHQNGLSVDFMTPVVNRAGESVPLPAHTFNRYGYDVEFDAGGRADELSIDFEAVTAHLLALKRAADAGQVRIWRVIIDPELQPFLRKTQAWPQLEGRLEFSKRRSWVRHDDHYHVDFDLPCRPLT
jgi:penicillin-insensitive murein endopeptidase